MPASAVDVPHPAFEATFEIRMLQLALLLKRAERYGFDPMPNELPQGHEPEATESILRRHLAHIDVRGTILDPDLRPAPTLGEISTLGGVKLIVQVLDRQPPLLQCILCGGPKGDGYTICAGCWTTQTRFSQRLMLEILPDITEAELHRFKPLTPQQFARAIRRSPRLEPARHARLAPLDEAKRRHAHAAIVQANRAALVDALASAAAEPGLTEREQRARVRRHRAAAAAEPWSAKAWFRSAALFSLDDYWLATLTTAGIGEETDERDGDDYPAEWLDADWMSAPDHVEFAETAGDPIVTHSNIAAGTAEHLEALRRNALFDSYRSARSRSHFQDGMDEYVSWLAGQLIELGGIPARLRARIPEESGDEECERWDRWVDSLLGGSPAPRPTGIHPLDAALCRRWGRAATTHGGECTGRVKLSCLDSDFPTGRIRWPHFVRAEIEAAYHTWGHEVLIEEDDGTIVRVWTGDAPDERYRRIRPGKLAEIRLRQLRRWAEHGQSPSRTGPSWRLLGPDGAVTVLGPQVQHAWEREIRAERRRRRFEALAGENAGVHPTHIEHALSQNV